MGVIDEIKQKIDIVDVIGQYVKLTKSGHTMKGLCPFHSEKHPSFFVYPDQQSWHCFGSCNTGGDVFSFIMKKEDIDFGEALKLLADRAGVALESRKGEERREECARLYEANDLAAQYFQEALLKSPEGERARRYIKGRGIGIDSITHFKLGFSPNKWEGLKKHLSERGITAEEMLKAGLVIEKEEDKTTHDRFRNRLMFPISDIQGRVVGFGGRALDDSMPKYLNSPQGPTFDKSAVLYGINLAKQAIRKNDLAVIVEGYMDAITAHQNGFDNVVASMGVAITERQMGIIKRLTKNLVLALDADEAGEEAMLRCVGYENTLGAEMRVAVLPDSKDPDDVIKEDAAAWRGLVEGAIPLVDLHFSKVEAKHDLTTAQGKDNAAKELLAIIAQIGSPVRQEHYMQKLASLLGMDKSRLEEALARKATKPAPVRYAKKAKPRGKAEETLKPVFSKPWEERCLELLLKHPEFKQAAAQPNPEHFASSENLIVFSALMETEDVSAVKDSLGPELAEYIDRLAARQLPPHQTEDKYTAIVWRLKEEHLRRLAAQGAQGTDVSQGLKQVFVQRARQTRDKGGNR